MDALPHRRDSMDRGMALPTPPSAGAAGLPSLRAAPGRTANLAAACCDRWADGTGRAALAMLGRDGRLERVTFDALRSASARLAAVLRARGIGRRDRVAILLDQGPEALVAIFGVLRLGAVAVPLSAAADPAGIAGRIRDSGSAALIADGAGLDALHAHRLSLSVLRVVLCTDGGRDGALSFWQEAGRASDADAPAAVLAGDPALLLHGADATGHPRAVLHAHRSVAGQAGGFALRHGAALAPGGLVWAADDWAGCSGLLDTVLPALFHGVPVLAHRLLAFDPRAALHVMLHAGVRSALLAPAQLRRLRDANAAPPRGHGIRGIATEGGTLDEDLIGWLRGEFRTGMTDALVRPECGLVLCATAPRPGRFGAAPAGRRIAILDAAGREVPPGVAGMIAVHRPDPALFLGYWGNPAATRAAHRGPWVLTGQAGVMDAEGAVAAPAGPQPGGGAGTAETFLLAHPAVARAAVIGTAGLGMGPEATAIVVPRHGAVPGPALAAELRGFLRARLSEGQCPRRVAFAQDLPAPRGGIARRMVEEAIGFGGGAGH